MADTTYYADGQWNFYCDLCGKKAKSSDGRLTWDGFWVCSHHKEVRNPQDFMRAVVDDQTVPWQRPAQTDTFVATDHRLMLENGFALLQEDAASNIIVN